MFNTKNDLSEATRVKAVELLDARLADCIDLQTQIKQAHWNVKGPNFIALHESLDKINEDVEDYVDEIAERGAARRHCPGSGPDGGEARFVALIYGGYGGRPQPRRGSLRPWRPLEDRRGRRSARPTI